MEVDLPVQMERQPDYTTCGPTALHAIYNYYGDPISLEAVIKETPKLPGGGTLGVHLSVHALSRGYEVDTWVCNTRHFDPTWFQQPTDVLAKLRERAKAKNFASDPRYGPAMEAVERYIQLGGKLHWGDVSPGLIGERLGRGTPLLTGTNGTFLYQCMRETEAGPDDVRGDSFGHFIVLCGYRSKDDSVSIADPLLDNPAHGTKYYRTSVWRLLAAIFLGVGSDDGNFMLIRPKGWESKNGRKAKKRGSAAKASQGGKATAGKSTASKKKPAPKKPASKKPSAKKPSAKKPSAKKPGAKRPGAKRKPSAKKKPSGTRRGKGRSGR